MRFRQEDAIKGEWTPAGTRGSTISALVDLLSLSLLLLLLLLVLLLLVVVVVVSLLRSRSIVYIYIYIYIYIYDIILYVSYIGCLPR